MKTLMLVFVLLSFLVPISQAIAGGDSSYPEIAGVMGIDPALDESCAAVWLAIPQGKALAGIEWFNNDASVAFPGLYLQSGVPETPMALDETVLAASDVSGMSVAWSEVIFDQPVTCASAGFYVIFLFPEGIQVTTAGLGGGPALGYVAGGQGAPGWLCSDGESYDKVGGTFGFAVLPKLVDAQPGMLQLMGGQPQEGQMEVEAPKVTELMAPFPNPFNPEAVLKYSVAQAGMVNLTVYDVRGRLVNRLVRGFHEVGHFEVVWTGQDGGGRRVSSGVYFVRFSAGDVVLNKRLVLIK
jgi:hypothetical protein